MRKNRDSTSSRDSRRTLGAPSAVRRFPPRISRGRRRPPGGAAAARRRRERYAIRGEGLIAVAAAAAASVLSSSTSGSDAPAATMISAIPGS